MYLDTHEALPPGGWYLKSRDVSAVIGPFLSAELLQHLGEGLPRSDAERAVTRLVERVVEDPRDGRKTHIEEEIAAIRREHGSERSVRDAVPVASERGEKT